MAEEHGIEVKDDELIHHKDGDKRHNEPDNFKVVKKKDHVREEHYGKGHDEPRAFEYVTVQCPECKKSRQVQYRTLSRPSYTGLCKPCNGRLGGVHK